MHCKNCGWNNPDNAKECEKCHSRFKNVLNPKGPNPFRPGDRHDLGQTPTIMGSVGSLHIPDSAYRHSPSAAPHNSHVVPPPPAPAGAQEAEAPANCPDCGYPLGGSPSSCPNCGCDLSSLMASKENPVQQKPVIKQTVLSRNPDFFPHDDNPLPSSDGIREITPANAASLLPAGTAEISGADRAWNIEALSEESEVYIRVAGGKFSLVDGDIILIDGKKYRFTI